MKPVFALITALLVALAPAPGFAGGNTLAGFIGEWVGNGLVRPRGFDRQEAIRCKVTGKRDSPGQVSFAGRCATPSGAGRFQVLIASDKSGKRLTARLRAAGVSPAMDFTGTSRPGIVTLRQKKPETRGARRLVSTITFTFTDTGSLTMSSRVTDLQSGAQTTSLAVRFNRRP